MAKAVTQIFYYNLVNAQPNSVTSLKFNTSDDNTTSSPVYKPSTFVPASGTGTSPYSGSFTGVQTTTKLTGVTISGVTMPTDLTGGAVYITTSGAGGGAIGIISASDANSITVSSWIGTPAPTGSGTFTITRGTNFSYPKALALHVVTAGDTTIFNRKLTLDTNATLPTGVAMYYNVRDSYTQSSDTLVQAKETTPTVGATPVTTGWSSWASMPTSYTVYDNTDAVTTTSNTRNGKYIYVVLAVSSSYTGGPNSSVTLPNIKIQYDEK